MKSIVLATSWKSTALTGTSVNTANHLLLARRVGTFEDDLPGAKDDSTVSTHFEETLSDHHRCEHVQCMTSESSIAI